MSTRLVKVKHWKPVTMSISEHLLKQLDSLRGDVSRSRYIQRLIEEHVTLMNLHMDNAIFSSA